MRNASYLVLAALAVGGCSNSVNPAGRQQLQQGYQAIAQNDYEGAMRAAEQFLHDHPQSTGGTAEGAVKLLRQLGAQVLAACFIIDLPDLGGADKLRKLDVPVRTLITFEGH